MMSKAIIGGVVVVGVALAGYFFIGGGFSGSNKEEDFPSQSVLPSSHTQPKPQPTPTPEPQPEPEPEPTPTPDPTPTPPPTPQPTPTPTPEPQPEPEPEPAPTPDPPSGPTLHIVSVESDGFHPRFITITAGDTIRWINNDNELHWPSADPHPTHSALVEFDPLADLSPGESYDFTFTEPGSVSYHDHTAALIADEATITGGIKVLSAE